MVRRVRGLITLQRGEHARQSRMGKGKKDRKKLMAKYIILDFPSCSQILTANQPGPQDSHGCPYRHFSPEVLQTFLLNAYPEISSGSIELREIMDQVKKQHYHLACTRVFELTHQGNVAKGEGLGGGISVNHPNEYFEKSLKYEK